MNPKHLLNLILLVVVAVLAGVAFFEPGKEESHTAYLTDIDEEAVNRVELRNDETLVFEKKDGHWRLAAPFAAPANDIRVRQLLHIAKLESRAAYPLNPEDLAKFGLDKPKAVLDLGTAKLRFGGFEPIDMMRYVQIGSTLHLVNDDFAHHLGAKATDYVDKKLLPEDATVKALELPGLSAKLGEKGLWTMTPPGDANAMAELAMAWQSARAIEVSRQASPPPGETARIVLGDGQTVEFTITRNETEVALTRADWKLQYLVAGEAGKRLLGLQSPAPDGDAQAEEDNEAPLEGSPDDAVEYDPGEDVDVDASPDGQ